MACLISFICINNFFFFSLTLPHFTHFSPASPWCLGGGRSKAGSQNGFAFEDSKEYVEKPLLWIFISALTHLSEENSTDVLVPALCRDCILSDYAEIDVGFLNFGGRRGGERLQRLLCCPWRCLFCLTTSFFCGWKPEDQNSDADLTPFPFVGAWPGMFGPWKFFHHIVRTVFPPLWTGCCYFGVITNTLPDLARFIGRNRNARLLCGF